MSQKKLTTISPLPAALAKKLDCRLVHSTIAKVVSEDYEFEGEIRNRFKLVYKCKEGCDDRHTR